ncbi:MAG: hypothetical protein Q8N74_05215, partial [Sulfuricella sp.]|nr:hypothetical protein [Sulfuricella sp.]
TGIFGDEESEKYGDALVRSKIMHLAKQLRLTASELDVIFKYEKALADVHGAPKEEHDKKWKAFIDLLKHDSEKRS